ncbi:hypothetical protein [Amycolatopsis lexingtonensis]|uniref:hypothetical protein n=1 Tax=Amycolatopsis lexingtonensis TaxID=218822 RepID=UPI003F7125BF
MAGWGVPEVAVAARRAGIPVLRHGFGRPFPEGIGLTRPDPGVGEPGRTAAAGVPQLVLPQGADQFANARAIAAEIAAMPSPGEVARELPEQAK